MSAIVVTAADARHLVVRLGAGVRLTEAVTAVLRDEIVLEGWLRATGTVSEVEIRTLDARTGSPGPTRRFEGHAQLLALEGAITLQRDEPSFVARVLCAREGALGLECFGGELVDAKVSALELLVTAFDQTAVAPSVPAVAPSVPAVAPSVPAVTPAALPSEPTSTWAEAARASEVAQKPPEPARPAAQAARPAPAPAAPMTGSAPMPARPARPAATDDDDQVYPDANDVVEHFAFGRCEVLKSDGDRLHVRAKDGRIKEIALEMLRVTTLGPGHFKLDRKL